MHSPLPLAALVLSALPLAASAEMIEKASPHTVAQTLDRLEAAVTGAGATIFARIDHAGGAAKIGAELRPTEVLIFGNPALGTPAMQDAQTAGLDLPLRVLAYRDADGRVRVAYHAPADLVATHGLPADAAYLAKMTGALEALTAKAVAAE
ncbi:DUF302 domain-containing protein [Dinoroseobacter sp. PD6]|uniref:DUF302 domain-containing protein n=1 Tax=Dinoroseobacter sp. PD6 TaxID=3028384 RepID=UPI00237B8423|nr:DUF302 domain-containing protein [Dinoroseobacter sp. PD6]MDD9716666.1 DUF302 domain-containing protein [Dinoroseobacter sp. PD6]